MKLLTKYSLVNIVVMVAIFIASFFLLNRFTQIILIREMVANLNGTKDRIEKYVKQYNTFPRGFALDEGKINIVVTGGKKISESSELTQMFSERENKMHNFMKLDFPLQLNNTWYKVTIAKPLERVHHLSRALITISLFTIFIIITISILLNSFLLRKLWKPFYRSMDIMRNFKLGETASVSFPTTSTNQFSFMNESLKEILISNNGAGLVFLRNILTLRPISTAMRTSMNTTFIVARTAALPLIPLGLIRP